MRPKKKVLLVDGDEAAMSVRSFLLTTRGYRVFSVTTGSAALGILETEGIPACVVISIDHPAAGGSALAGYLKHLASLANAQLPILLISSEIYRVELAHPADMFLGKSRSTPAGILEAVKVLSAQKRGPKKPVASAGSSHEVPANSASFPLR